MSGRKSPLYARFKYMDAKKTDPLTHPLFYCVAGVVAAAAFKFVRDSWWGIIVLGALIILYAYLAYLGKNKKGAALNPHEVGDNCYFIGFVYTLAVITASLVLDADDLIGADGDDGLKSLLKTIGVALGTSVVGMTVRFMITHGALAPESEFDQRVEETAQAAANLKGVVEQLEGDALKMAADVRVIQNSMRGAAESVDVYAQKIKDASETVGEELSQGAAELLKEFGARVAETLQTELLNDMRRDFGLSVKAYAEAVQKANETFGESLSALDQSTKVATANIASVNSALNAMNTRLSGENWEKMREVLNNFAAQVGGLNESLRGIAEQQDGALNKASQDIERLRSIHESFDGMLKGMRDDIDAAVKIKEDYRREYDKAANAALKETHALYARLISGAELAIAGMDKLGPLANDLQKIASQIEKDKGGK